MPKLEVLAERQFRLLWIGQTVSALGDSVVPVALAFAVLDEGGGASGLGFVLACFAASKLVLTLAGGVWADRRSRRTLMLACDSIRAVVQASTAVALFLDVMDVWMFAVVGFVFAGAGAVFVPAASGLVPETVSSARLQEANALLGISRNSIRVFGPVLSGVLVAAVGTGVVYSLDSASFLVSAAFLYSMNVQGVAKSGRIRFIAEIREGWAEVRSRAWLLRGFVSFGVSNFALSTLFVLGPVVAKNELQGASSWGIILSGGAIGGVVGSVVVYKFKPERPLLTCFLVWLLVCAPLFVLAQPLPTLACATVMAAFGFSQSFGNPLWETVLQREIPPSRLSRVISYDWMLSLTLWPIGLAVAGPIADSIGTQKTLILAGAISLTACIYPLTLRAAWSNNIATSN